MSRIIRKNNYFKLRLDQFINQRGDFKSRDRAKEAILGGFVSVNGKIVLKPAYAVELSDKVELLKADFSFVSRGGVKLEAALKDFRIAVSGMICLDIGVATGGFTDCLLQSNASKVYAVDVGEGQIEKKLLADSRVIFKNYTDARNLRAIDFKEKLDLIVIDVSFISVLTLLPALAQIADADTKIIVLIKPQFELGKAHDGVIKDQKVIQLIVKKLRSEFRENNFDIVKEMPSPILGKEGNQEFLWQLKFLK